MSSLNTAMQDIGMRISQIDDKLNNPVTVDQKIAIQENKLTMAQIISQKKSQCQQINHPTVRIRMCQCPPENKVLLLKTQEKKFLNSIP